ncbi:MAG: SNF2-related protein [Candidatus Nanoarchaeia archaeon]|nr:SNF2-related protein [Candidatus Nanoarchaeia archaeon]
MAQEKDIPVTFEAEITKETLKAVFVEGKGIIHENGICAQCGKPLKHKGSIILGIGPECLGSWTTRDIVLDNLTQEDIDYVHSLIITKEVKTWLPKAVIKNQNEIIFSTAEKRKEEEDFDKILIPPKKRIATLVNDDKIKIIFDFDIETLNNVKSLSKRTYKADEKIWYAALTFDNIKNLKKFGFELSDDLKDIIQNEFRIKNVKKVPITGLNGKLMPFQEEGVNFVDARKGRAIIGDEMGLGKTVQAIGYLHICKERPAIVVVPASLKGNWKKEIEKWIPNVKVKILSGTKSYKLDSNEDIIIVNYDILKGWDKELLKIKPKIMVLDESHSIKNDNTKRTKVVKSMSKKIPYIIALSGTPAVNRPIELYNVINIIEPKLFSSRKEYGLRYCNGHYNGYGMDYNGFSNLDELYEKLQTIMIRRKKSEVLTDLPDKTYSFIPFELDNTRDYNKARDDIFNWIKEIKGEHAAIKSSYAETLVRISELRQLAVRGVLKSSIEWLDNFIESSDQKIVVFAIHKEIINALMNHFGKIAVKIDGTTPVNIRQDIVDQFQTDNNIQVFVGNIKAAGVGLTLTAASNVAFLELPWTPGDLQQATDRVHRIGQKNAVNVYFLLAQNTIEEDLAYLIDSKKKILTEALDGVSSEINETNMISDLISKFKS